MSDARRYLDECAPYAQASNLRLIGTAINPAWRDAETAEMAASTIPVLHSIASTALDEAAALTARAEAAERTLGRVRAWADKTAADIRETPTSYQTQSDRDSLALRAGIVVKLRAILDGSDHE